MGNFFDWFRLFHHVVPHGKAGRDRGHYHRHRFVQEQRLARAAPTIVIRDLHRRLAAEHRVALERLDRAEE